ncbi:MAG: DUF3467 domain-containing protein [Candidatus Spechtbacterales bacterium]
MQNQPNDHQHQQVQIKTTDEALKGKYSNMVQILHTKEEFVMDFLLIHPHTGGQLLNRMVLSPGHMKRLAKVLGENLERYETNFGKIEEGESPTKGDFGFETK